MGINNCNDVGASGFILIFQTEFYMISISNEKEQLEKDCFRLANYVARIAFYHTLLQCYEKKERYNLLTISEKSSIGRYEQIQAGQYFRKKHIDKILNGETVYERSKS